MRPDPWIGITRLYPEGIASCSPALPRREERLRWVKSEKKSSTLKGLHPAIAKYDSTLSGLKCLLGTRTQGRRFAPTLG